MRVSRIFIDHPVAVGDHIQLEKEQSHYLLQVLRLKENDKVLVFNSWSQTSTDPLEYFAILSVRKKNASILIQSINSKQSESPLTSILLLGVSKGDRMDYGIQKATELGVSQIFPVFTCYGDVKLKGERLLKKQQHWQKVAISAAEQSGRVTVPKIGIAQPLVDVIAYLEQKNQSYQGLVMDAAGTKNLKSALHQCDHQSPFAVLIGPEGGLTEEEIQLASKHHFQPCRLGPRILRTETAPAVVLSLLQYELGDFR